ncbi:dinuclear metal center protein [[Clostridium] sordellii]|uniref:Nif3-like dinuclear metal center hexameric protein n=1 Tax=Paraclostridium sordellii TaxID=1505 RepID=UPI0005E69B8E|nr:Nif3-like dinuclear metal center hexameric protein [Paeniclostridium sordellii]MDU4412988.1 Nif3-like dinuclear metal center hexameric protein [Paeniclostridium sordellii]MRZ28486.1 Nif3-like dinuclear metal center hexameric protein [Paeniclostridium sordellii]MVO74379.1 Nif3-like dinuclear metal center hexameric protein [Paeniclostridium sordellii]CEO35117.1 dinuclear metal center protein [[Clostridium] sordellii] [Paeniclostridium sordellii]CEP92978.1 dinuclear metal center protein [[Clos
MKLKSLIKQIEKKYPLNLAYDWDNVGLLVGDYENEVKKIMVVLEANEEVVNEAIEKEIDLIITHHPFIFSKMKKVTTQDLKGKLIHKLIKNNISIYSMHTNFDIAFDGLNDYFVDLLNLKDAKILEKTNSEGLYKLAVYVPKTHLDKVRSALGNADAGHLGNYKECSFSIEGEGRFRPYEGANPYIGEEGALESVNEVKIETIVPQKILGGVINAMIKSHPYEEVAYDLYKLENKGEAVGLGRYGKLEEKMTFKDLGMILKEKLDIKHLRVVGNLEDEISKVAIVTGSGADMVKKAFKSGCDVLITGDMKYHDAQDTLDMGMKVIDCGHFDTEKVFADIMFKYLDENFDMDIIKSDVNLNPFDII